MEEVNYIPGDLVMTDYKGLDVDYFEITNAPLHRKYYLARILSGYQKEYNFTNQRIKPILLSTAILEANGWKKNEYGVYYKNFNPYKAICLAKEDGTNWGVSTGGVTLIHCKFVHQLQHLLFGLGLNSELKV